MCGIVGYIGNSLKVKKIVEKLKMLEYRGYDSAGIYGESDVEKIELKSVGNISKLEEMVPYDKDVELTIAHTRWATHGKPTKINCHPHYSKNKEWIIVHNGIIENFNGIKNVLKFQPESESDTAVVSQLLEEYNISDIEGFIDIFKKIEGSYAIAAIKKDKKSIFLAKNKSPLYVAKTDKGIFVASDPICFKDETNQYISLDDGEFAIIEEHKFIVYDKQKTVQNKEIKTLRNYTEISKNIEFEHFMLKEIYEQSSAVNRLIKCFKDFDYLKQLDINFLRDIKTIKLIGCGTAYHACLIGARYIEKVAGIKAEAEIASEFIYKEPCFLDGKTLVVAISQSGETADTLKAIQIAKTNKAKTLAITNVDYSTIVSVSDKYIPVCAGPERAVASTKAYVCQLCVLYIFANHLKKLLTKQNNDFFKELINVADNILNFDKKKIDGIAQKIKDKENVIFIGKDLDFVTAQESSLKLKEVTYINSSSYPSGELKHGYLALVEEDTPLFVFATNNKINQKTLNASAEAESRGAYKILISNQNIDKECENIIKINCKNELLAPIMAIVPMQYLAYKVSILKNINPDQPKNLAKSVTVE